MNENLSRPVEILLVEDDPGDTLITTEALAQSQLSHTLRTVTDGEQALAYLRGDVEGAVRPDLILLDLNLPRLSGTEVLREVKASADLRRIPVIVFTTSTAQEDILRSYDLHANAYITKPLDMEQFIRVVKGIDDFWFGIVRLPGQAEGR